MSEQTAWRAVYALLILMCATGVWAWVQVPADAQIAFHFNAQGQADSWGSPVFAFGLPVLIAAGIALLPQVTRRIDPRKDNVAGSGKPMAVITLCVVLILTVAHGVVIANALGRRLDIDGLMTFALGLLFAALGNMMPKLRSNFYFGIRTPWTLSDDHVWEHTHRFSGWVFMLGGLTLMAVALMPSLHGQRGPYLMAVVVVTALAPVLKSWLLWRKRHPH